VELWPRRSARDGDAAGREEEECAPRVSSEDKPQGLVCWMRKELAELGHTLLRWRGHWFDDKSSTELIVVGDDVSGAMVVKTRNQWVMEYHSIAAKMKQDSAGAEAYRGALATAKRSRWGRCQPRGRKARTASFR